MRILNHTQNSILAEQSQTADSFIPRLIGLLNRSEINQNEALIIVPCQQIHMFFMRFSIDVVFVDTADLVVGLVENIHPFSMSPIFRYAHRAIELPAGTIAQTRTCLGDAIQFVNS